MSNLYNEVWEVLEKVSASQQWIRKSSAKRTLLPSVLITEKRFSAASMHTGWTLDTHFRVSLTPALWRARPVPRCARWRRWHWCCTPRRAAVRSPRDKSAMARRGRECSAAQSRRADHQRPRTQIGNIWLFSVISPSCAVEKSVADIEKQLHLLTRFRKECVKNLSTRFSTQPQQVSNAHTKLYHFFISFPGNVFCCSDLHNFEVYWATNLLLNQRLLCYRSSGLMKARSKFSVDRVQWASLSQPSRGIKIERTHPFHTHPHPLAGESLEYFRNLSKKIRALTKKIRKVVLIWKQPLSVCTQNHGGTANAILLKTEYSIT